MTRLPDLSVLSSSEKDDLIRSLWALVEAQRAKIEALEKRIAELEAALGGPPKDPTNSSVPRKPCRLWVISGRRGQPALMSALGQKQTFSDHLPDVRFRG